MNIVPDWVLVALQTLPFLVTFLVLRTLLFRPFMAYLEERRAAIDGARAEAEKLRERLAEARALWEQRLAEARAEGVQHRVRIQAEANAQRQALLDRARAGAEAEVAAATAQIGMAHAEASVRVEAEARQLAALMAERVLGRPLAQA
jgi:F-type H+-transporting ATPase subunit b